MWDAAYLLITLVFFAAMLWYVRGCDRLGGGSGGWKNLDDNPAGGWRSGGRRDER